MTDRFPTWLVVISCIVSTILSLAFVAAVLWAMWKLLERV